MRSLILKKGINGIILHQGSCITIDVTFKKHEPYYQPSPRQGMNLHEDEEIYVDVKNRLNLYLRGSLD